MTCQEEGLQMLGCVVKGKPDISQEECSACGIMLYPHQGIILSHGSILFDLCLKNKSFYSRITHGELITSFHLPESNFTALIDSKWTAPPSAAHHSLSVREMANNVTNSLQLTAFKTVKCSFIGAFRNDNFHDAVRRIMPDSNWTFVESVISDSAVNSQTGAGFDIDETSVCFNLLSYFVIFKTDPVTFIPRNYNLVPFSLMAEASNISECTCNIGDVAEIIATPFGSQNPSVFFNTYSRGIVSNVSGARSCWILTDARCIPGSEGSPLFTRKADQSRHLAGIIVASLCWKNKEWVGFALACSLQSVKTALQEQLKKDRLKLKLEGKTVLKETANKRKSEGGQNRLLASTVLVSVGSTWGSGIIVSKEKSLFITCGHVIKDSHHFPILIKPFQGSPQYKASIVYAHQSSSNKPFDIAILKCVEAAYHIPMSSVPKMNIPKIGEKAWVIGHALFNTNLDLQPSVSAGVVSKINSVKGHPVVVQTTCAVHPGASGGPLLNDAGDLLGIVVCNTVDKGSNSSFPNVNMSIPAVSVRQELDRYIQTGDSSVFAAFEIQDPYVKKLWALEHSSQNKAASFIRSKI